MALLERELSMEQLLLIQLQMTDQISSSSKREKLQQRINSLLSESSASKE